MTHFCSCKAQIRLIGLLRGSWIDDMACVAFHLRCGRNEWIKGLSQVPWVLCDLGDVCGIYLRFFLLFSLSPFDNGKRLYMHTNVARGWNMVTLLMWILWTIWVIAKVVINDQINANIETAVRGSNTLVFNKSHPVSAIMMLSKSMNLFSSLKALSRN